MEPSSPKLLATLDTKATTIEEVARELAIAIATALDGDGDGAILVGPASAIMDDGKTLGLNLMLARPPGARSFSCKSSPPSPSTSTPQANVSGFAMRSSKHS